ncbi:hypothetical protein ACXX83_07685 [Pseudomonas sp. GNP012]
MPSLANHWTGRLFGTNTGNIFLELSQSNNNISGQLRIMDSVFGVSLYSYTGTIGDEITLHCTPLKSDEGVQISVVDVKGTLTPQGSIRGEWKSEIGTAGTFEIFPHDIKNTQNSENTENSQPEQIHNKTIQLGSVRLFKEDIIQLINFIKKDFTTDKVVITYSQRGSELTIYANAFLNKTETIEKLNYLKLVIQEPEAYGINRVVIIELTNTGTSEIRVSGINESWVLGKAESTFQLLKPKQNLLVTNYRKYGLNLNGVIFFAMLITIPEITDLTKRLVFVFSVFILLNLLLTTHNKLIPNTAIYLTQTNVGLFARSWPTLLSWLIAVTSSVVASIIFALLKS